MSQLVLANNGNRFGGLYSRCSKQAADVAVYTDTIDGAGVMPKVKLAMTAMSSGS